MSDELADRMDAWASLLNDIVEVGVRVGTSNAAGRPTPGSPYAPGFKSWKHTPRCQQIGSSWLHTTQLAYLSAAGRHCLAVCGLLASHEVFLSLLPLLRAQLETYGRIAWFLEPGGENGAYISPSRRVARHHMDILASACRERFSAKRRKSTRSKVQEYKRDRDAFRDDILQLFPDAQLVLFSPPDEASGPVRVMATWASVTV